MKKIKVLLVDDSAVIRKILGDHIAADPELEVVGTAANGRLALEQLERLQPDVITMDIEMPEMDGLQTVKQIRSLGSQVPIIMCSSLTSEGASHTLDALSFGASDYVTKPSSHGINSREVVGDELVRKIKGLAQEKPHADAPQTPTVSRNLSASSPHVVPAGFGSNMPDVIAIGVSTGGPNALQEVLPRLPAHLAAPVLIVQHMPPLFTKLLADRLSSQSILTVVEAQNGEEVKAGRVYLAPGGMHMEVKRVIGRTSIVLHAGPLENSCRPAVDVLFRSIAAVYGAGALAVILTGMGQDGLKGCMKIKEAGGTVIAQDRDTSAVWGMPSAVIEAGLTSAVLPLGSIAAEIASASCRRRNESSRAELRP